MSWLLRGFIFAAGLFLVYVTLKSLIMRRLSEWQSLFWLFSGAVVMLIGLFPWVTIFIAQLFGVDYVPSIFFAIAIIIAMYGVFYCFRAIAVLQTRVHELAMQVSMLNQENSLLQVENRRLRIEDVCGVEAVQSGDPA